VNRADSAAITRSPASASASPPPAATPLTAVMTGFGVRTSRETTPWMWVVSSLRRMPIRGRVCTKSLTSPPPQKAFPAPVRITQRTAGSSSTSSTALKSSRASARLSAL
jgi:hypothetical protein